MYTSHRVSQVPEDVSFHLGSAVRANKDASLAVLEEALADEAALHGAGQGHGLPVLLQLLPHGVQYQAAGQLDGGSGQRWAQKGAPQDRPWALHLVGQSVRKLVLVLILTAGTQASIAAVWGPGHPFPIAAHLCLPGASPGGASARAGGAPAALNDNATGPRAPGLVPALQVEGH